jgi:hypothetical protein
MSWAHIQGNHNQATGMGATLSTTLGSSTPIGRLIVVCISNTGISSAPTVTDSAGNTYTQDKLSSDAGNHTLYIYHTVTTASGTLTITYNGDSTDRLAITADEYSFTAGSLSVASTSLGTNVGSATASTGNLTFTQAIGLAVLAAGINALSVSPSAGTGFFLRQNIQQAPGTAEGLLMEDFLNVSTSPIVAPSLNLGASIDWYAASLVYQSSGDSAGFTVSPSTIPTHHSGNITLTLTGVGTSWVSGTTVFTLPSITGLTKVSQSITSGTAATIVCTTGATTGTGNITDNTDSATAALTVSAATLAIAPTSGGVSTPVSLTLTGTNTLWSSETASTLFAATGGTSPSISGITVTSNTAATATLNPGSTGGTITVTDSSTTATASFTATGTLAVSPTSVVQSSTGLTLTLTGVGTSWTSGTPGSPTFTASAGTITAQTVTSATSATLTYNSPAASASPVTITDPSTGATASLTIATSNLANGTASTVSVGNTIATVTVGNATGGTPPYSYQWYRSTTSGFTPGGGNIVAGATNQTLNDTGLTNGLTYFYVNVVTDSA